jgi:hypothetical protein
LVLKTGGCLASLPGKNLGTVVFPFQKVFSGRKYFVAFALVALPGKPYI